MAKPSPDWRTFSHAHSLLNPKQIDLHLSVMNLDRDSGTWKTFGVSGAGQVSEPAGRPAEIWTAAEEYLPHETLTCSTRIPARSRVR